VTGGRAGRGWQLDEFRRASRYLTQLQQPRQPPDYKRRPELMLGGWTPYTPPPSTYGKSDRNKEEVEVALHPLHLLDDVEGRVQNELVRGGKAGSDVG